MLRALRAPRLARRLPALAARPGRRHGRRAPAHRLSSSPPCCVPLHDPIRLAEDIAVLDLISGGRLSIVTGLGYRPVEYDHVRQGVDAPGQAARRVPRGAWCRPGPASRSSTTAQTVQVTPRPVQQPHPTDLHRRLGARRRPSGPPGFGFSLFPSTDDPELAGVYREECERLGTTPGLRRSCPSGPGTLFVADDPDRLWGQHRRLPAARRHDLPLVAARGPAARTCNVRRHHGRRAAGRGRLPDPHARRVRRAWPPRSGPFGAITHHPLCGAHARRVGWASLELFVDKVLPRIGKPA